MTWMRPKLEAHQPRADIMLCRPFNWLLRRLRLFFSTGIPFDLPRNSANTSVCISSQSRPPWSRHRILCRPAMTRSVAMIQELRSRSSEAVHGILAARPGINFQHKHCFRRIRRRPVCSARIRCSHANARLHTSSSTFLVSASSLTPRTGASMHICKSIAG